MARTGFQTRIASMSLLFLWLAALSIVSATKVDHALKYRQIVPFGTGVSASTTAAAVSTVIASTIVSTDSPSSNVPTTVSDSPSSSPASSTPTAASSIISTVTSSVPSPSTSSSPSSQPLPDSSSAGSTATATSSPPSSSAGNTSQQSSSVHGSTVTARPVSSRTEEFKTTAVTVSGTSTFTHVVTTSGLRAVSTAASTSKGAPSLGDNNNGGNARSGLQPSQKRIIIGTVVGIGGAILLVGILIVAWRIWGKRKQPADEDNDLISSRLSSSGPEKRSSVSDHTPFRSTLDQYHSPAGPVNTASNF